MLKIVPQNQAKSARLLQQVLFCTDSTNFDSIDIESIFSKEEEQTEDSRFAVQDDVTSESDSQESTSALPILQSEYLTQEVSPSPHVLLHLLPSKYDRPLSVLSDTWTLVLESQCSTQIYYQSQHEPHIQNTSKQLMVNDLRLTSLPNIMLVYNFFQIA